ncbi:MAG: EamA family transporter [Chloroflexi bacterium]|nr:EamA family transporter [Chloroflexota bacterium]
MTSDKPRVLPIDGLIALFILYVLWGSTFLGIKFALQSFPPFLLGGTRFPLAGALMLIYLKLRGTPWPTRRQWMHCALYGLLMIGVSNGLLAVAETQISSGLSSALAGSSPLLIALLAGFFGHRPRRLEWIGIIVGFAGLLVINSGDEMTGSAMGMIALIVSSVSWALGSVLAREKLDLPGGLMTTAVELLLGGFIQLAISMALGERLKPMTNAALGGWIFLVAASIVGFSSHTLAIRKLPVVLATSFSYVNPIVAIFLGILLASETLSRSTAIGIGVTLVGVVLISIAQARGRPVRA